MESFPVNILVVVHLEEYCWDGCRNYWTGDCPCRRLTDTLVPDIAMPRAASEPTIANCFNPVVDIEA